MLRSFELGMDDDRWTDAVMEEVDGLLPMLIEASHLNDVPLRGINGRTPASALLSSWENHVTSR